MGHSAAPRKSTLLGGLLLGASFCWLFLSLVAFLGFASGGGASACRTPSGGWVTVGATVYESGAVGAYGVPLAHRLAYAELGLASSQDPNRADANRLGVALGLGGPLPPFTRLLIKAPDGRVVEAEKLDVGMGGPPIDGKQRAIDLWRTTREALGLPADWAGLVGVLLSGPPLLAGCAAGQDEGLDNRIVAVARSQLGVAERPLGSGCNPYGPCEPWCSLFASWVWRQAGVAVPALAFSGALYEWARSHTAVYPPTATPKPGWAVFFGSGPQSPSTSLHVAVVEAVLAGQIVVINGNFASRVARSGPCLPAQAQSGCAEPGPIYGYAAP